MICPSCSKQPSSFRRYSFSKQGVSIVQNAKGFLTCQHCGTLLRVVRFGKQMWYYFASSLVALAVFVIFHKSILALVGTGAFTLGWIGIAACVMFTYSVALWKYGIVEKVEPETPSPKS